MTNKFKLIYMADGSTNEQTEVFEVVGYYAEALEKANQFLNANYYSWEIVDLHQEALS